MGGRNREAVLDVIILVHPIVIPRRLVHITAVARRGRRAGGRGGGRGRGTGVAIIGDRHRLLFPLLLLLLLLLLHLSRGEGPLDLGHGLITGARGRRCCYCCILLAVMVMMLLLTVRKGHGGVNSKLLVVVVDNVNGLNLGVAGTARAEDATLSHNRTHSLGGRTEGGGDVRERGLPLSVIIRAVDVEHGMLLPLLVALGVAAVRATGLCDGLG